MNPAAQASLEIVRLGLFVGAGFSAGISDEAGIQDLQACPDNYKWERHSGI